MLTFLTFPAPVISLRLKRPFLRPPKASKASYSSGGLGLPTSYTVNVRNPSAPRGKEIELHGSMHDGYRAYHQLTFRNTSKFTRSYGFSFAVCVVCTLEVHGKAQMK